MVDTEIARIAHPRRDIPGEDPAVARLNAITLSLLSELVVARERIDTLERLLEAGGVLQAGAIDAFEPDSVADEERRASRRRQIDKVMRPLKMDARLAADALCSKRSTADADEILKREMQR